MEDNLDTREKVIYMFVFRASSQTIMPVFIVAARHDTYLNTMAWQKDLHFCCKDVGACLP